MLQPLDSSQSLPARRPIADTLERLRLTANISHPDWYDLLAMHWKDYQDIRVGKADVSDRTIERVAKHFALSTLDLVDSSIDFQAIALNFDRQKMTLPEIYSKAAFGRRRTSMTSVEYLELRHDWRLKLDTLRALGVSETALTDPFAPISMGFITDLCAYLRRRQFTTCHFFEMGAYTYLGNRESIIGQTFSQMRSPADLYELFFGESMRIFEQNCAYTITQLGRTQLTLEVLSHAHVAAELGVRHLGSMHVCSLKAGMFAVLPQYLDLPRAHVRETACVHRGASVCQFEICFADAEQVRVSRLA